MVKCDLPPAFGERLNEEARKRSMSPFAYGSGVLSAMLAGCADAPEVTIGTQVAGRTEVDLEPLIGAFINNVVMRFPTPPEATLGAHLDRAKGIVQEALMGQHVPFNKLVETLNPGRDPSRTPLISINFILQHAFMETARYGDFELSSAPSHAPGAIYDLSFVLIGRVSGWRMTLEYNSDLFDPRTADALLALWRGAFAAAFDTPDRPLSEMPKPEIDRDALAADAHRLALIETALAAHPQVGEAAAVQYSDPEGRRRVHAFVSPSATAPLRPLESLPASLGDHLLDALPGHVRPDAISVLRDLPKDATDRIAKVQLPLAAAARAAARSPGLEQAAGSGPSADAVEARLAPIWAELLGLDQVPPTANFFELGGHSLLTVRMLARIEQEFGHRVSLATAYHSPTLRALARHLAGPASPEAGQEGGGDWRVLQMNEDGEGIPLIAINNAQTVYALSQSFARPRPVLAVRTYDAERGIELEPRSFDDIAAEYVDAIRSIRPRGPYALFGVCVHGNLAIEVARQLRAAGQEVVAVILKDVWEPSYGERVGADQRSAMLNRLHFLRVRLRSLRRGDISLSAFLGMFRIFRTTGLLDLALRFRLIDRVRYSDLDAEQENFIRYLSAARNRHKPDPYDGAVLHFVTSESPSGSAFDPTMGWGRIVTGRLITKRLDELSIARERNVGINEAARAIEELLFQSEPETYAGY